MGSRGAAPTLQLMMMLVATFALAAAIFLSTAAADCPKPPTVQGTSGRFHRPEGGEDGLYIGTLEVDEEGVERHEVKYLGKLGNTTFDGNWPWPASDDVSRAGGGRSRKLLQQDSGAHCQDSIFLDGSEIYYAVLGIADHFGYNGNTMPGRHWMSYHYGCTLAYVCNFGEGDIWSTASQIWSDHHFISTRCQAFGAGWFAHDREGMNAAFGRTLTTSSFCGL